MKLIFDCKTCGGQQAGNLCKKAAAVLIKNKKSAESFNTCSIGQSGVLKVKAAGVCS